MSKPLIIVESPTKIKTLEKYIGDEFKIAATVGHIRDLPEHEMGINIKEGFQPKYITIPGKQKIISSLKKAAEDTNDIYLAPDPDREGEAIAWHTAEVLKKKGRSFYRVLFHELTKNAIHEAIKSPTSLDKNRYEAQQARRILDRLVGYQISPILWKKVKAGLSAGRVQSVAVRIICEREREIQAFIPEEYWTITAYLEANTPPPFTAKLSKKSNKKISISNEESANSVLKDLKGAKLVVEKVVKKTIKRNPYPPFTTSKLQQDAIRKLKFTAKKTMLVAQQLYEGIELGPGEPVGLITYMRTDSTRIANEAALDAIQFIRERFGSEFAIDAPRFFENKKKVQDAHEAIRPTSVYHTPEQVAPFLNEDQLSLYRLIWNRFIASQMAQALIDHCSVAISAGDYLFNATGSSIKFPGFTILYMTEDDTTDPDKKEERLPELIEGMELKLIQYEPKKHFTQPPPRFTEASLVKELEEKGIGRPSTYATILSTIREKGYVELVKGYFRPSELGLIVNDLIVKSFPDIMDVEFTARMEDNLDKIESAEIDSLKVLTQFYERFEQELNKASDGMLSMKAVGIPTDINCPQCNKKLHIKFGKNGHFLACSGYPDCKFSRDYVRDEKGQISFIEPLPNEISDKTCTNCGKPMVLKHGKYGSFLACSGYPDCKTTLSISNNSSSKNTGIHCPKQGCDGELIERKSKRGKAFYGCSKYPDCNYAIWDKPVPKKCPACDAPFLVEKTSKKEGTYLACLNKDCGYKEITPSENES